jgi:predicted nucleic acid-binding protein
VRVVGSGRYAGCTTSSDPRPALYLDVCCINRLYDDRSQYRVNVEADAVRSISHRPRGAEWRWVSSEVVTFETARNPDVQRRASVRMLAADAETVMALDEEIERRAKEFEIAGISPLDALHLACAERGGADVFMTVDDVCFSGGRGGSRRRYG